MRPLSPPRRVLRTTSLPIAYRANSTVSIGSSDRLNVRKPSVATDAPQCDLFQRNFDDFHVLVYRAAAHPDTSHHGAVAHKRHAAAHGAISAPGEPNERKERLPRLRKSKKVGCPHADKRGRVGLPFRDIDRERRCATHAMFEDDVAVDIRNANC